MKLTTIFEQLIEADICFSVGVNQSEFKIEGIDNNRKDYFILIMKEDNPEFAYFHSSSNRRCLEYELSENDIIHFKSIQDLFIKKVHNADGRIYELKNNSFSEYFNSKKDEETEKSRM